MALKNRQYFNGGYQANMNALQAVRADETEKNVQAGKKALRVILVAVAFIGIMHFTTGCTDGERSPFCYFTPEGQSTLVCGK